MPTVTNASGKINVLFYGKNPYFLNVGMDLDRAGCKSLFSEILYSDSPRIYAVDLTKAENGDKLGGLIVGGKTKSPVGVEEPKCPEQIVDPNQALQYAKAYLEALGYKTSIER